MFHIIVVIIIIISFLLIKSERDSRRVKHLFSVTKVVALSTPKVSVDQPAINIRLCEETMLRLLLDTEFVVDGSYVATPKRTLYHLGHLDNPEIFKNEYKADGEDNLDIVIIKDPKDFTPNKSDCILVFYTRNFIEQFGDLNIPIDFNPSSFSLPVLKGTGMTYDGKLYERLHDDNKYVQLVHKRLNNDTVRYAPTSQALKIPEHLQTHRMLDRSDQL